jgi:hypothetical protein
VVSRSQHAVPAPDNGVGPISYFSRVFKSLRERRALRAARHAADAELLDSAAAPLRLAWRAAELVGAKQRLGLASSLRGLVRDADPRYLPNAQVFDRGAVRAASQRILAAADRLAKIENPVSPRGVLLLEHLLGDTDGPLYDRDRAAELVALVDAATAALELP